MGLKVIGLLGVLYLNIKKGFMPKEQGHIFIEDAIAHGYRISSKMVEDVFAGLG